MCIASVTIITKHPVPVLCARVLASSLVVDGVFKVMIRLLSAPSAMAAFFAISACGTASDTELPEQTNVLLSSCLNILIASISRPCAVVPNCGVGGYLLSEP